jgi:hypothetical protein
VRGGICEIDCQQQLKHWFQQRRKLPPHDPPMP